VSAVASTLVLRGGAGANLRRIDGSDTPGSDELGNYIEAEPGFCSSRLRKSRSVTPSSAGHRATMCAICTFGWRPSLTPGRFPSGRVATIRSPARRTAQSVVEQPPRPASPHCCKGQLGRGGERIAGLPLSMQLGSGVHVRPEASTKPAGDHQAPNADGPLVGALSDGFGPQTGGRRAIAMATFQAPAQLSRDLCLATRRVTTPALLQKASRGSLTTRLGRQRSRLVRWFPGLVLAHHPAPRERSCSRRRM
jgi:hypothetical protein